MSLATLMWRGTSHFGDGVLFVGPDGRKEPVGKYTRKDALQCDDCGTLVVLGRFADPL